MASSQRLVALPSFSLSFSSGIAGVGAVGGVSFLAIVWFFFIKPTQRAVTDAPKQSGDNADSIDKPTAKDQAVLFNRTSYSSRCMS